ncbi:MAG: two-partner secretion domain-containing protein [Nitrospiraceae bacterium]
MKFQAGAQRKSLRFAVMTMFYLWHTVLWTPFAWSNPTGISVVNGVVTAAGENTAQLTLQQATQRAIVNFKTFNIAPNEVTSIIQPVGGWMLGRIGDVNPSLINGNLNATGGLILLNPNGVLFGPNAQVNVSGLMASTLNLTDTNFLRGHYLFEGHAITGLVKNEGTITAGIDGVYLLAANVENHGIIRSPDGHITLAAGSTAFLSNRPDGRGFLAEVTAPTGQALNVKDLIADGGQITLAGKVVNQQGLAQANSVRERNGRIELVAADQVNIKAGSRTHAKGDVQGASNGGTVIAKATNRTTGSVAFATGAEIDVSGGTQGGHGGEAWLGGVTVTQGGLFKGLAGPGTGFQIGRLQLIPNSLTVDGSVFSTLPKLNDVTLIAMDDIVVNGAATVTGTLRFDAGRNLQFTESLLQGNPALRSNVIARAGNDIILKGTKIETSQGGSIHLHANRDVQLQQGFSSPSQLVTATLSNGGNISVTAGRDIVTPGPRLVSSDGSGFPGIHVGNPGNLTIRTGRDLLGVPFDEGGPGFLLEHGRADVVALRNIGSSKAYTNIILGSTPKEGSHGTFTTFPAHANLNAGGSLYFGLAQDFGLLNESALSVSPQSSLALTSTGGNIHLKPTRPSAQEVADRSTFLRNYPATFSAKTEQGSIFVEDTINFWASPTGAITFSASQNIQGVPATVRGEDPNSVYFFRGVLGDGEWVRVTREQASNDPKYAPWFTLYGEAGGPTNAPDVPEIIRVAPLVDLPGPPVAIQLLPGDQNPLVGSPFFLSALNTQTKTTQNVSAHSVMPVSLTTEKGDISTLRLDMCVQGHCSSFKKQYTLAAGRDIKEFVGTFPLRDDLGTSPSGQPILPVSINAKGSINLKETPNAPEQTGFIFIGKGSAQIRTNGNLDLADSDGITHQSKPGSPIEADQGGIVDIGIGGNLEMTKSKIFTFNGAKIWIHGLGADPAVDPAGRPTVTADGPLVVEATTITGPNGSLVFSVNGKPVQLNKTTLAVSVNEPVQTTGTILVDRVPATGNAVEPVRFEGKPVIANVEGKGLVMLLVVNGRATLADAKLVSIEQPVGGKVNVGTNVVNVAEKSGIVTQRGGSIDIKARGDVDVNKSRIGTLGGGNINVVSITGDINAGSGSKDEVTQFLIRGKDPVTNQDRNTVATVPGSGIFTFHPNDPDFPLPFPQFDTPQITGLKNEIIKQRFFGRDTSGMERQLAAMVEARTPEFNRIFDDFLTNNPQKFEILPKKNPTAFQAFLKENPSRTGIPLELGDINLNAGRDLVVPPAGIRGRRIDIRAGRNIDLRGGTIEGQVNFSAGGSVVGSLASFVGSFSGAASGGAVSGASSGGGSSLSGGLSGGITGTVAATASATAGTSSTASKMTAEVQQSTADAATTQSSGSKQVASKSDEKDKDRAVAQSVRVKRGVTIQVDVKPQQGG